MIKTCQILGNIWFEKEVGSYKIKEGIDLGSIQGSTENIRG
jgi:hypothetical protein